jgi:hypothetical protein
MFAEKEYTFYNLDRIEDDSTCETQRNVENTRYSNHVLTNLFSDVPSDSYVKFATSQPAIVPGGTYGGSGVGSNVETDSYLTLKTEQERSLGRLNLLQRPYLTVPYLGRGSCDPTVESQLRLGEAVADKKSVSTIMTQSFMGYSLYPTSDKMEQHVSDPKYTVEEAALDGWVRGGASTREQAEDYYSKR